MSLPLGIVKSTVKGKYKDVEQAIQMVMKWKFGGERLDVYGMRFI